MIDSHAHLTDPRFINDVPQLLQRMTVANVGQALVIGCDLDSSRAALALARQYPQFLRASLGVHPHDATLVNDELIAELYALAADPLVVAIGEIGLDYHYNHSPPEQQQYAFRTQIKLAEDLRLPLIIHEPRSD